MMITIREHPFNLKGGGGSNICFLLRSVVEYFFHDIIFFYKIKLV